MTNNLKTFKIAIIGNGGGGKTTLSLQLAKKYNLPVTHVDDIQYLPNLSRRPLEETKKLLNQVASSDSWIIDGFGPLDVIEKRFETADKIIFIDFPLWRHYWWCTRRQIKNYWYGMPEKGEGNAPNILGTINLYKILWKVHTELRPKFLKIFNQPSFADRVITIKSLADWNYIYDSELMRS